MSDENLGGPNAVFVGVVVLSLAQNMISKVLC